MELNVTGCHGLRTSNIVTRVIRLSILRLEICNGVGSIVGI